MKILHLALKKKWFDMIASGEKKEEYREIKPYWITRLIDSSGYPKESKGDLKYLPENIWFDINNGHDANDTLKAYFSKFKTYDKVTFKNGYSKDARAMTFECMGIEIGKPNPDWLDGWQGELFIIKLGDRL